MRRLPKVVLRNVAEQDLAIFYQIQREREGYEMAVVVPRTEADFFHHWHENILSNPDVTIQTIESEGAVVGDVTSFIRDGHRLLGYWISKKYWGRGITTAAVNQFITLHEKRRPLLAFVAVSNVASYRVLQKCGFHQVGEASPASDGVEEYRLEIC